MSIYRDRIIDAIRDVTVEMDEWHNFSPSAVWAERCPLSWAFVTDTFYKVEDDPAWDQLIPPILYHFIDIRRATRLSVARQFGVKEGKIASLVAEGLSVMRKATKMLPTRCGLCGLTC